MARRSANRLGSIKERKDGTGWRAKVELGGHRYEKRVKDEREGVNWVAARVEEFERGQGITTGQKGTLKEFLAEWSNQIARSPKQRGGTTPRSPKTTRGYQSKLALYVIPTLGGLRLDQLTPTHVDRLWRWMADGRVEDTEIVLGKGRGVSPRTIHATWSILRAALDDAVGGKAMGWNPLSPKLTEPSIPEESKYKPVMITVDQWRSAIAAAESVWAVPWSCWLQPWACGGARSWHFGGSTRSTWTNSSPAAQRLK